MSNNSEKPDLRNLLSINFRVKVYSNIDNGKSINSLRGYSGLINLIGNDLTVKFVNYALSSEDQVVTLKLRRGLTIKFYSK